MKNKSEEKKLLRNYILNARHFHLKISMIQDILVLIHGRQKIISERTVLNLMSRHDKPKMQTARIRQTEVQVCFGNK